MDGRRLSSARNPAVATSPLAPWPRLPPAPPGPFAASRGTSTIPVLAEPLASQGMRSRNSRAARHQTLPGDLRHGTEEAASRPRIGRPGSPGSRRRKETGGVTSVITARGALGARAAPGGEGHPISRPPSPSCTISPSPSTRGEHHTRKSAVVRSGRHGARRRCRRRCRRWCWCAEPDRRVVETGGRRRAGGCRRHHPGLACRRWPFTSSPRMRFILRRSRMTPP